MLLHIHLLDSTFRYVMHRLLDYVSHTKLVITADMRKSLS